LQQTAALLSAWLHTRLGLAGLELGEARDKLVTGLLWSAVALLLAGLGLLTLSIAVTLLFWDTWRWQSLLVLSGIYLVLALWVGWWVRQKMRQGDRFLQATLTVLEQDKQAWSQR
jgi:uncharacterized membrane protein YqjE